MSRRAGRVSDSVRCTYPLASLLTGTDALKEVSDDGRCVLTLVRWSHDVGDLIRAGTIICRAPQQNETVAYSGPISFLILQDKLWWVQPQYRTV